MQSLFPSPPRETAPAKRWRTYIRDGVYMDLPCIPHDSTLNPDPDGSHARMLAAGWRCCAVTPLPGIRMVYRPINTARYL